MPAGRPPKISKEIVDKIVQAIELGAYIETAAAHAGIHKDTFYRWLKEGARSKKPDSLYLQLSDAIQKAQANSELRDILVIQKAAQEGVWQAAAWKLERKFPDRWGRREKVELTGKDGGPIEQQHSNMTEEELRARAQELAERLGKRS